MILVDTSVWIDHLRHGNRGLVAALEDEEVATHPFVLGELACGHLKHRAEILGLLHNLPEVLRAEDEEALGFLDAHRLWGRGVGWVDVHLLASARLSRVRLWTLDRTLAAVAQELGIH